MSQQKLNTETETNNETQFSKSRVKELETLYSDTIASNNRYNRSSYGGGKRPRTVEELRRILASEDIKRAREASQSLFRTDPIYSKLIEYYANIFYYRYTIVPHRIKRERSTDTKKSYLDNYQRMIEIAEGLNPAIQVRKILKDLFINGATFFTTYCDVENETIDIITIPPAYAKNIGQTNFGTNVIQMDLRYFDSVGLSGDDLNTLLNSFPSEIKNLYLNYKQNNNASNYWVTLDPRFSSCLMLNNKGLPTLLASSEGLMNYEQYSINELEANTSKLERIVWHKMPLYEDQLVFNVDEVKAIHKSMSKIINASNKTRLITTFGELHVENIGDDSSSSENNVLSRSFKSIFNKAGINDAIFTGESVTSLKYSLTIDKSIVWGILKQIEAFFNLVINNYFSFGAYQADISFLHISPYSYDEDMKNYRDNATLGIGKLDFIVASGISQKNLKDRLELEDALELDLIRPLNTSYTQSSSADTVKSIKETPSETVSQKEEVIEDENETN